MSENLFLKNKFYSRYVSITKVFVFLGLVSFLVLVEGYSIYGRWGLLAAFFVVIAWNFYIYFYSDRSLYKVFPSRQLEGSDPWGVCQIVHQLACQAEVSTPRVFMISLGAPTAFSVGLFRRSIFISEGMVEVLTREELRAILAHEIFHIKHSDTLSFGVASAVMSFCLFWGDYLDRGLAFIFRRLGWKAGRFFVYFFMPLALVCLILIISLKSDYRADQFAVAIDKNPEYLAQALWKLESYSQTKSIEVSLAMAHFFIVNPFRRGAIEDRFFFMPSVEDRIRRLINRYPL